MSFIELEVKYDDKHFRLSFDRRITFVRGDSGDGKTTFVEAATNDFSTIRSPYPLINVDSNSWQSVFIGSRDTILIFDDLAAIESNEFADYVSKYCIENNLYLLIFDRTEELLAKRLSYAVQSIYKMVNSGTEYWIEPVYPTESNITEFNMIFVEDSTAGYEFFAKNFCDCIVKHAINGKSSYKGSFSYRGTI